MKLLIIGALLASSAAFAQVQCVGSGAVQTCTDLRTGNTYMVNRMGSMTMMQGSNPNTGSQWSQTSQQFGNMNITNGVNAQGRSWNETQMNMGNGTVIRQGVDAYGRPFTQTCNQLGCF